MIKNDFFGKDLEKQNFASQTSENPAAPDEIPATPDESPRFSDDDFSGRDEMNLAGNPFALLSATGKKTEKFFKQDWLRRLPNGREVKARWEVTGHAELGLPGPSDELLYLVLLELTREASAGGPWPQTVHFSRYELLERLGWARTAGSYNLLRDCFARLQSVSIQADNVWWDAKSKQVIASVGFALIDIYKILDEPRGKKAENSLPLSFWKWSDVLHASFVAGNVKNLALDFVVSLDLPTSRRLFRFLDMMRRAQTPPRATFEMSLFKLRDRLGMVNLPYASKIREKLAPAHEELLARGFLSSVEWSKTKSGDVTAIYRFGRAPVVLETSALAAARPVEALKVAPGVLLSPEQAKAVFDALPEPEKAKLREQARQGVEPAFWDRLENPASPISLGLWKLIKEKAPESV